MNTKRSSEKVKLFKEQPFQSRRVEKTFYWQFRATPQQLFSLLCAAREADWLEETNHEIVFFSTGYAEKDYIFKSDFFGLGQEIWVRFRHIGNKALAYYRFSENLVIKFEIDLHDNFDKTVNTHWCIIYTSLTEKGNTFLCIPKGVKHQPHAVKEDILTYNVFYPFVK
jgi:hypothetical protein